MAGAKDARARKRDQSVSVPVAEDARAVAARIDDVRKDWGVRERAWLKAMNSGPSGDRSDAHAAERRVAAEFAEAANRVREALFARVNAAAGELARRKADLDRARADEAEERGRFQLAVARSEHLDDLVAAEREAIAAARDQRLFRARHRIAREPQPPRDQIVSAALLAAILMIEAAFNTPFFYVEGNSLAGSAFEGLLVSGANIALGFLAGVLGLRFIGHREFAPWRLIGLVVFALTALAALGLNWMMAARRMADAAAMDDGDAVAALMASLNPVVLTVAFSTFAAAGFLFAAYKGWQGFFEPYPGYGYVARNLQNARRKLEDVRHDFHQSAVKALEEVKEDLEDELDEDRDAVAAMRTAAAAVDEAEMQARDALSELKARARWLIRLYREAIAEVSGERPGGAFDVDAELDAEPPSVAHVRAALAEAEARLEENESAYARGLAALSALMARFDDEMDAAMDGVRAKALARDQEISGADEEGGDAPGADAT